MTAISSYDKKSSKRGAKSVRKDRKRSTPQVSVAPPAVAPEVPTGSERSADADLMLVERCLAGDETAWQEMFQQCQPKLLLSVRSLIGKNGHGTNLAEEITARVWLSLVAANGSLLDRYDSERGSRLTTFLASLARHELLKHWRGEQRRENRERRALDNRLKKGTDGIDHTRIYWHEFMNTLSGREREFVDKVLLASPNSPPSDEFSQANTWQLRRRVMAKLRRYFHPGASIGG